MSIKSITNSLSNITTSNIKNNLFNNTRNKNNIQLIVPSQEKKETENKEFTVTEFINGTTGIPPMKNVLVGMVFGTVFGFIDNAGMFFGMDALEPFLPTEGFIAAGVGNTYSSVLGAFIAAFLSNVIKISTGVDSVPVWSDAAGIIVGAILGIFIPPIIVKMF